MGPGGTPELKLMAWRDTLLNASYKGIEFDVERIDDAETRALAVHEFPYRDGAEVEDLGLGPKRVRFTAVIFNANPAVDDAQARLERLLAALRSAEPGALVHPVFGSMPRAICASWQISFDAELRDGARIALEFVEVGSALRVFTSPSAVQAAEKITTLGSAARDAADASLVRRVDSVRAAGPAPRTLRLKTQMQAALGKLRLFSEATSQATLLSGLDPIFSPQGYAADARALMSRGLQGLPFGGRNLLATATGAINALVSSGLADFDRAAQLLGPQAMLLPMPNADGLVVQAHAQVHASCTLADAAAVVLAAELELPLLDTADVERMAATARTAIQAALDALRTALPGGESAAAGAELRALAFQVQAAATAVIEQRPPVVLRTVPLTGPLRLVAHAFYGDHTRAPELARLNRFGATLVATAGQQIKAYAT